MGRRGIPALLAALTLLPTSTTFLHGPPSLLPCRVHQAAPRSPHSKLGVDAALMARALWQRATCASTSRWGSRAQPQRTVSVQAQRRPASENSNYSVIIEDDDSLIQRVGSRGEVLIAARGSAAGSGSRARRDAIEQGQRAGAPPRPLPYPASNIDAMRAKAGVLRTSILQQQRELERLERKIDEASTRSREDNASSTPFRRLTQTLDRSLTRGWMYRTLDTFYSSTKVLRRKLVRVREKRG
jgi:hypothetical protein